MAKRPPPRGLFTAVIKNFRESMKLRSGDRFDRNNGEFRGVDPTGNQYYEIPPDPRLGKKRGHRWYITPRKSFFDKFDKGYGFDSEIPSEWDSWLRHRRTEPPSDEEVLQNMAVSEMKKINAARLESKRIENLKAEGRYTGAPLPQDHEKPGFPKYQEYELFPGDKCLEKDRWSDYKNPYNKEEK